MRVTFDLLRAKCKGRDQCGIQILQSSELAALAEVMTKNVLKRKQDGQSQDKMGRVCHLRTGKNTSVAGG